MLNFLYLLDMVHSHNHLSSMNQEHSYLVWLTPWKNAHRTARMTEGQIPLRKSLLSKHHCHNDAGWKPLKFERQYIEWEHSGKGTPYFDLCLKVSNPAFTHSHCFFVLFCVSFQLTWGGNQVRSWMSLRSKSFSWTFKVPCLRCVILKRALSISTHAACTWEWQRILWCSILECSWTPWSSVLTCAISNWLARLWLVMRACLWLTNRYQSIWWVWWQTWLISVSPWTIQTVLVLIWW